MHIVRRSAIFLMAILSCYLFGEEQLHLEMKSEGALIISWNGKSSDVNENQINISDLQGNKVVSLNVLRPVPDAMEVSIWDVSARGSMIAVAAIYKNKQGNRPFHPVGSLLLFDLSGRLLSAFALAPTRTISLLAVDDQSNVWTLTDGGGVGVDPSSVPMVVEYSPEGKIVRELLTRNMFPSHARETHGDSLMGWPAMGYGSGMVWFWLPGSTDLVTISTNDGKTTMMKTQLPKSVGRVVVPLSIAREASGTVVAHVREDDERRRPEVDSEGAFYTWSPLTESWARFKPGACEDGRLIGTSNRGQVYLRYDAAGHMNHCVFLRQSVIHNGGPSEK